MLARLLSVVLFAASRTSYDSIYELLNAPTDSQQQIDQTRRWRDYKLEELSFVGITAALVAGLFGGAFSWFNVQSSPWLTRACWYCGLITVIASISTATQQSISLLRISSHDEGLAKLRMILCAKRNTSSGASAPRLSQIYLWQVPVMLLRVGILLFLAGLLILLWNVSKDSDDDLKIAIASTVVAALAIINYVFCSTAFYYLSV